MTWCSEDSATPRLVLASSAIRCRCVDRFVRPKVLSHVSRQRFSPHGTPLPSIGSRRVQFPDVTGPIEVLRLPATHLRSLICFASGVHAIFLVRVSQLALPEGWRAFRAGVNCSTGDPICRCVARGRERDLPGSQTIHPMPLPRSTTPAEPTIPRLFDGSVDAAPTLPTAKASALMNFGAQSRGFGTCYLRFKSDVATTHAKLASGWLARSPLPGGS